jgi:hypothetical protein
VIWTCVGAISDHLVELAANKSGSNVLETLIQSANPCQMVFLANSFLHNHDVLMMLAEHEYGNYVVQRLLRCGTGYQRMQIQRVLLEHFSRIDLPAHSRHLYELVSE